MLGIDIESEFINKNNIDYIWKYINSISTDTAKIFYLYFILGMTFKQISEELEIKKSTVKTNLYRMLKNINKNLLGGGKIEK